MFDTIVAVRACAGGHTVSNANVIGMTVSSPGAVDVWCIDHAAEYDAAMLTLGAAVALEM